MHYNRVLEIHLRNTFGFVPKISVITNAERRRLIRTPYPLCIQTNDYHSTHNMQYHDCHVDRDLIITNRRIPPLYKKDYY